MNFSHSASSFSMTAMSATSEMRSSSASLEMV